MVEDSEKRFEAIMNRIFNAPKKSKPSSNSTSRHGVQTLRGGKRLHSSSLGRKLAGSVLDESGSSLSGSATSAQVPLCRPWDRDDLLRRLSTFKSMTWFAKPQVVSPLECARRGWVNVDMDTIACASCDARLFFSTPSTWTQQQVEKAATVFSLKLESGHKLLCPWINNACSEELAQFPTLSRDGLIEEYKKRFFSLSQLIALTVVLPVAIANMRSSQLEQFLRESSVSGYHEPLGKSMTEVPQDVHESTSFILYYQAQKLISLFGWEPRMLPYKVDFKDGQNQSVKDADGIVAIGQKPTLNIYSLDTSEATDARSDPQFDPSSVVLDCKLCGASVGLWAFKTIPRPLEYLRFVGLTEVTGENIATHDEVIAQEGSSGDQIRAGSREADTFTTASTSSSFTIAGGPPPAMLNYGATISLPFIGHNLRARLSIESGIKDQMVIQKLSQVEDDQRLLEGQNMNANGTCATMRPDSIASNLLEVPQSVAENSMSNVDLSETVRTCNSEVADCQRLDAEVFSCSTPKENAPNRKRKETEPDREGMVEAVHGEQGYRSPVDKSGIGLFVKPKPAPLTIREDTKLPSVFKSMEFDPVKQHRHFCPWITSTGKFSPGWQQTLSALEGRKELTNMPSSPLIEVDDPVASVRYLFASPNKKRT